MVTFILKLPFKRKKIKTEDVLQAIEQYFYDQLRLNNIRKPDVFYVTELTGCLLYAYRLRKDLNGILIDLEGNGLTKAGSLFHLAIENIVKKYTDAKVEVPVELKFEDFKIIGRADIVFPNKVVEVKTTTRIPEPPYEGHLMQLAFYTELLQKPFGEIVYINRANFEYRRYRYKNTDLVRYYRMLLARAVELRKALKENKPPRAEPTPLCKYCPFYKDCPYAWKNGKEKEHD